MDKLTLNRELAILRSNQAFRDECARLAECRDELLAALKQIVEHCANEGYGNPIVDNRIVDRCQETAMIAIANAEKKP